MKRLLVIILAIIFVLCMGAVAYASGYNAPGAGGIYPTADEPHGGYLATTDYCKTCHAVHGADAGYTLLRGPDADGDPTTLPANTATADNACDYCHIGAGAHSGAKAYDVASPVAEHNLGATGDIPDSSLTVANLKDGDFKCNSCHSVHGANTIAASKILRNDPADNGGAETTPTGFCGDCHDENDVGAVKDSTSHVMKASDGTYAFLGSSDCASCHTATDDYPHTSANYALLKSGADSGALDDVCIDCHQSGGNGVGLTY